MSKAMAKAETKIGRKAMAKKKPLAEMKKKVRKR